MVFLFPLPCFLRDALCPPTETELTFPKVATCQARDATRKSHFLVHVDIIHRLILRGVVALLLSFYPFHCVRTHLCPVGLEQHDVTLGAALIRTASTSTVHFPASRTARNEIFRLGMTQSHSFCFSRWTREPGLL